MKLRCFSFLALVFALASPGQCQEPRLDSESLPDSLTAESRGEAKCWLHAALHHHLHSYDDLLETRGVQTPEQALNETLSDDFPPNSGILIYDYIEPWRDSSSYKPGEEVLFAGALYRRTAPTAKVTSRDVPSQHPEQWDLVQSCQSGSGASNQRVLRAWLVTKAGIEAYAVLPFSPEALNSAIHDLDQSVNLKMAGRIDSARGFDIETDPHSTISFDAALDHLSDLLVPRSFWPLIRQFSDLIVVPQLAIAEVPFSLFRTPDGARLADTAAIWIARSIGDLEPGTTEFHFPRWNSKLRYTFESPLVVGNPTFHRTPGLYLPPLPGAEEEARAVASIMHTTPLTGNDTSIAAVESLVKSADEIYIATHGAALPGDPLSGFLALAGAPEESGRWSAKQIQSLDLSKTDLAVLSACQTGLGGIHAAGVIGVGRAFTLAGVRWVVMSLWNVDDKTTSDLMQAFITNLATCTTVHDCVPAEALRKAMLSEKSRNPDPKAWGPFVVFGVPNGKRLKTAKTSITR
jgi:hypothetical protein